MAVTPSNMVPLGTQLTDFELMDVISAKPIKLSKIKSDKANLVIFMCNHCPYVIHILDELVAFAKEYQEKGVTVIAINANDIVNYPADSPDKMKSLAADAEFTFPYCFDEKQTVAKSYDAACTPDFYLADGDLTLVYRGQFDDSRPGNNQPIDGKSLRQALEQLLAGEKVATSQKPSTGCNIKWKTN